MTEKPHWLDVAWGELGQEEINGPGSNPRIVEYLKTVGQPGDDDIPWCSAFVNWCLMESGIKGTCSAAAKSYLEYGNSVQPRIGAIAVMNRGSQAWQGHVAFIAQVNFETVILLGGNQSNRVSFSVVDKKQIVECRYPIGLTV
jgi:uncharacterized protein (TIGR02594 family)